MKIALVVPLISILIAVTQPAIGSLVTYFTDCISTIYSVPGVFPSFWACVPTVVTDFFLAIFVLASFTVILKLILR